MNTRDLDLRSEKFRVPAGFGLLLATLMLLVNAPASAQLNSPGDVIPPQLSCPSNVVMRICGDSAPVSYTVSATDDNDPKPVITCVPPVGATLSPGTHLVVCTANDAAGNKATCQFEVAVVRDELPPALVCPSNQVVSASTADGLAVNFKASGVDSFGSPVLVECLPPSGSTFALGTNLVICSATNSCGKVGQCTFTVVVVIDVVPQVAAWRQVQADSRRPAEIYFDHGIPASLEVEIPLAPDPSIAPLGQGLRFLEHYKALFRIASPSRELVLKRDVVADDEHHLHFSQIYRRLPVFGAEIVVHLDNTNITGANGRWLALETAELPSTPRLTALEAGELAKRAVKDTNPVVRGDIRLMYFNHGLISGQSTPTYLVWRVNVTAEPGPGQPESGQSVFVDALTGDICYRLNLIPTHDPAQAFTIRSVRDGGREWFTERGVTSAFPGDASDGFLDGRNASNFLPLIWDYFFDTFGRSGWDGRAHRANVSTHEGGVIGTASQFMNAQYSAFYDVLRFGEGFVTLDVAAHEFTHAVTHDTSGLIYADQPGAMNEHFSDFFGAMVDADDWFHGEDLPMGTLPVAPGRGPVRDLRDPSGPRVPPNWIQPDHMLASQCSAGLGLLTRAANGDQDDGWVHFNSGILNKAAYLLVDGGLHAGISVRGIGRTKTQRLWYNILNVWLTSDSQFMDARNAAVAQARRFRDRRLYGFTSDEVCSVINAFAAVGLGIADSDCDGRSDDLETDNDNDGIPDSSDNCPNVPNPDQADADLDNVGDVCDPDRDGDTVLNLRDNCPMVWNPGQVDSDGNNIGDACQDSDGDSIRDLDDNCPSTPNRDQRNADRDNLGDACDPDRDGDGIPNETDNCPDFPNTGQFDRDQDGVGDSCDNCPDTPNSDQADTDGDHVGDACDTDIDNDGVPNLRDNCPFAANPDQLDTDGNGIGLVCDTAEQERFRQTDQLADGFLAFETSEALRIPLWTCLTCPPWNTEVVMRFGVSVPVDLPMHIEDDQGFLVARGTPVGSIQQFEFRLAPDSFYPFPEIATGGAAVKAPLEPYIGTRYYLVGTLSPGTPLPRTVPIQFYLGDLPPLLTIRRDAGVVTISWSAPAGKYLLETSAQPADPSSWAGWKEPVVRVGSEDTTTVPQPLLSKGFFRLRKH